MYAIALSFTSMLIGVRDDAFLSNYQSARMKSILSSGIDVDVLPLYVHATDDLLSYKLQMCLNFKSTTKYYRTSHRITNPDNSRSFIVNLPFGFF